MKKIIVIRIPFSKREVLFRRISLTNFLEVKKNNNTKTRTSRDLIGKRTNMSENMGYLSVTPAGDRGSGATENMEGCLLCNVTLLKE